MTSDAVPDHGPDPVPRADTPRVDTPGSVDTPPTTPPTRHKKKLSARDKKVGTRAGYTWVALVAATIIGILLLIFILQNLDQVPIHLFFWQLDLPLGVTMLLSVIAGALVMALAGGWRIVQLRRAAKRR